MIPLIWTHCSEGVPLVGHGVVGEYVKDGLFDPEGLEAGTYPVIYTVGDGNCLVAGHVID